MELQGTLFIYWSILYFRLDYICRCYIGNWRINKLLLPHYHYYGTKNPLTKAFVLLAPFLDQTNIINPLSLISDFDTETICRPYLPTLALQSLAK